MPKIVTRRSRRIRRRGKAYEIARFRGHQMRTSLAWASDNAQNDAISPRERVFNQLVAALKDLQLLDEAITPQLHPSGSAALYISRDFNVEMVPLLVRAAFEHATGRTMLIWR